MVWHLLWEQEQREFDSPHLDHLDVAQFGLEHSARTRETGGSNPSIQTIYELWPSGLGHRTGGAGVAGSNPANSTWLWRLCHKSSR